MPKIAPEFRLFEVCLDRDKKDIMINALDNQLDLLERSRASSIRMRETKWLKDEIEKIKIC